jgi:sugar phosphate isomerase/epimerase
MDEDPGGLTVRYVYFTKSLRELSLPAMAKFATDVGVDGLDLTVRPGYPVNPDNVVAELPKAVRLLKDAGLVVGLVTMPTNPTDPEAASVRAIFDACGKAGIPAIKIGYFPYKDHFDETLAAARKNLTGLAALSKQTGVKACVHTHSGNNLGNNAAALRLLLTDLDPHHVGAFLDTGHTAVNGGPIRLELDTVRPWLSLLAIKDVLWQKGKDSWTFKVVPAGEGIVRWNDFAKGVKECKFNGTVSIHAEYTTANLAQRKEFAKAELALLKKLLG